MLITFNNETKKENHFTAQWFETYFYIRYDESQDPSTLFSLHIIVRQITNYVIVLSQYFDCVVVVILYDHLGVSVARMKNSAMCDRFITVTNILNAVHESGQRKSVYENIISEPLSPEPSESRDNK